MKVLTVNVGVPITMPGKRNGQSGIDKRPVDGPVSVTAPGPKGNGAVGLAGDHAYQVKHHGGADQAIYAYAREDLDGWEGELGRTLPNGAFGENLTTAGVDVNGALIGERWRVGADVVLEVSCPRIPCTMFERWLDKPGWIKRFTHAGLPGAYLRVVTPGDVQAGDPIELVHLPEHDVTITFMMRALTLEPDLLPRLVAAGHALPAETTALIRKRSSG